MFKTKISAHAITWRLINTRLSANSCIVNKYFEHMEHLYTSPSSPTQENKDKEYFVTREKNPYGDVVKPAGEYNN